MKKILLVTLFALVLSACGTKKSTSNVTSTLPPEKVFELPVDSRPYISLTPREDGHLLTLKVTGIPASIKEIEYEVLYNAIDGNNEIEKGAGDTVKDVSQILEKSILLGTESCTSGCKYNYDAGVIGGTISLNLITADNQVATYQAPFTLKSVADLKKSSTLALDSENFSIKTNVTGTGFFILLKNYNGKFSVFSSSSNSSKFVSTTPTSSKDSTLLTGDYTVSP